MRALAATVAQARILLVGAILLVILLGLGYLADRRQAAPAAAPIPSAEPTEPLLPALQNRSPTRTSPPAEARGSHAIRGHVIDVGGEPVSGARVLTADYETATRRDGSFRISAGRLPTWVTVVHPGFLARTRAAAPGAPLLVRLTPDDGETVSLHFAGDTMFGRRFYDPNEDGVANDGLLGIGDAAGQHLALLAYVRPLLDSADLTVLNLESALSANPYLDPTQPRPSGLHPTKEYVFLSHTSAAEALRLAGVDVVDLANNHVYDALDNGMSETLLALEQAGFEPGAGYFGAGISRDQAWRPAVVTVRGQSIAFLGCTTITRPFEEGVMVTDATSYVADDARGKGGAAGCTQAGIRAAVGSAAGRYDAVVFMVHGGQEYEGAPSPVTARMTAAAREAGARLVIGHHAHVTGELDWDGSSLVADSLGNFVFDQTIWPTFETYLLTVDIRRGQVVRAYVEPLIVEGFLPKGVTGQLADRIARRAAGSPPGPWVLENGALEVDVAGRAEPREASFQVKGALPMGAIYQVGDGWWASDFTGSGTVQPGRDLLRFGSFEDEDVDADYQENAFWDLQAPHKVSGPEYAFEGQAGVRLERGARDSMDAVLSPLHRILIEPRSELSVVGMVRANRSAQASVQLSWYPDTRGPSSTQTLLPISLEPHGEWHAFRFDATAPEGAVAVGLYLRLAPPRSGLATADLDNLRLITWSPSDSDLGPRYTYLRALGEGQVALSRPSWPGGESAEPKATLVELGE